MLMLALSFDFAVRFDGYIFTARQDGYELPNDNILFFFSYVNTF